MRNCDEVIWVNYERDLKAEGKSGETIAGYRRAVGLLSDSLPAGTDLLTMRREHVAGWLAAGAGTWSKSTLATYSRRARTFCAWAVRSEWREDGRDPMRALKPVKEDVKQIAIPDPEHVRMVLQACRGKDFRARRDAAMICVLCEPGTPRASELAGILLADTDLRSDSFLLRGKGGLERRVPFGATTGRALGLYLRARDKYATGRRAGLPQLFIGKYGKMTRYGVAEVIAARCEQAGVPAIPPHHFRHMTADAWFREGGSETDAMTLFGWRSRTMAGRYGGAARESRARGRARQLSLGDKLLGAAGG